MEECFVEMKLCCEDVLLELCVVEMVMGMMKDVERKFGEVVGLSRDAKECCSTCLIVVFWSMWPTFLVIPS